MYLLKLALRPWRLAPLTQFLSAAAVGFLLFLAALLFWMERGLKPVVARLQGEQVITAYIDGSIEGADQTRIVDTIRTSLGAKAEIRVVGSREFLDDIQNRYPELKREIEDLGNEMTTVVPRYISVTGVLPGNALERVKTIGGIEAAESSKDRYQHIVGAFKTLRRVARLLGVGLALALFTGLLQLSRMNAHLHGDAVSLLRLWGAGPMVTRLPGMLASLSAGLIGGVIAFGSWLAGGLTLAHHLKELSPMLRDMPLPSGQIGLFLLAAGAAIGLAAGVLSSLGAPGRSEAGR